MIEYNNAWLYRYTFIDLFAGLGGFHLALDSFGAKCVYANEWDPTAQKLYYQHFARKPEGDITKVAAMTIPDHDILCAGFPCQAFSISGKKLGFEDSRGTLFFDVARIVREKRPKVVFMENVRNFATHDNGHTLQVVRSTMEELGYTFHAKVLNAADFGVPQQRERIYMVCFRNDLDIRPFRFPEPIRLKRHVEDILVTDESMVRPLYVNRTDIKLVDVPDDTYRMKPIRIGSVGQGRQGERIYSTKGVAITLSAYGGGIFAKTGGYLVNGRPRKLHPIECANLMGFPGWFVAAPSPAQAYKLFGNSVVVDVLQYITIEICRSLRII